MIVAEVLTDGNADDAKTALDLVDDVEGDIASFTAGAALRVKEIGRRRWKKESGYPRQARVESVFFRYKSIIGDRLRARHPKAQEVETLIACNILNEMTTLGRPESFAIRA